MIWIKKGLKILLISVTILTVLLFPFLESSATYYAEEFPSEIGLSGGYFVKFRSSSNVLFVVLIPDNHINSFAFQGNGTLINTTTSTISTRLFNLNSHTVVNARFSALSALEYYSSQSWNSMGTYTILDMNIYPKSSDPAYANQNLHLDYNTRHLVIVLVFATMLIILFRSVKRD